MQNEQRAIHQIPVAELNSHIAQFFLTVRKRTGEEYEPVTLRSMMSSFERYLKRHNYGISLISGYEFSKVREVLKCKQKDLKKQGHGNKPRAVDEITDQEIDFLYEANELGSKSPTSLINTLWFNNTLHFGMRGGSSEHRNLCWGDLSLNYDHDLKTEYIEYNEHQTKTRTGKDINNIRGSNPRMYASGQERCPVKIYKKYACKRPQGMLSHESPFYLATATNKKYPMEHERWFISQPIGVNKINRIMKTMVENANLPGLEAKRLSNTSVRKHLCQKLLNHNVPDTHAAHVTGHKNPNSLNNYRKISNRQQHQMSNILGSTENIQPKHSSTYSHPFKTKPLGLYRSVVQVSSCTENMSLDSNSVLSSVFGNSHIYGGTFNINLHIDQPKKPRTDL